MTGWKYANRDCMRQILVKDSVMCFPCPDTCGFYFNTLLWKEGNAKNKTKQNKTKQKPYLLIQNVACLAKVIATSQSLVKKLMLNVKKYSVTTLKNKTNRKQNVEVCMVLSLSKTPQRSLIYTNLLRGYLVEQILIKTRKIL